MAENKAEASPGVSPIMQHIGMLNLRVSDMMTELNTLMKMMMEENASLKKENDELKSKNEKKGKS